MILVKVLKKGGSCKISLTEGSSGKSKSERGAVLVKVLKRDCSGESLRGAVLVLSLIHI